MKRHVLVDAREKELRLSQLKVAEKLKISRTFYNQIENGTRNPNLSLAMEISQLFRIPVEKIFNKDASSNHISTGTAGT